MKSFYFLIIIIFVSNHIGAYSMPDPSYKEVAHGSKSKITAETIKLIGNQKDLVSFCKTAGVDLPKYQFEDKDDCLLFCFSGNSNAKDDLILITKTRQHSLDWADMTVYLERGNRSKGHQFQPYIAYGIRAARRPDHDTSLFILKHHKLTKEQIHQKKIKCVFARMIRDRSFLNDGKTYTPQERRYHEKFNTEDMLLVLSRFFGKVELSQLKVSLSANVKHNPQLFEAFRQTAGWSWSIRFNSKAIKKLKLASTKTLYLKHKNKNITFDLYQWKAHWHSKPAIVNIAYSKEHKKSLIFITDVKKNTDIQK